MLGHHRFDSWWVSPGPRDIRGLKDFSHRWTKSNPRCQWAKLRICIHLVIPFLPHWMHKKTSGRPGRQLFIPPDSSKTQRNPEFPVGNTMNWIGFWFFIGEMYQRIRWLVAFHKYKIDGLKSKGWWRFQRCLGFLRTLGEWEVQKRFLLAKAGRW